MLISSLSLYRTCGHGEVLGMITSGDIELWALEST